MLLQIIALPKDIRIVREEIRAWDMDVLIYPEVGFVASLPCPGKACLVFLLALCLAWNGQDELFRVARSTGPSASSLVGQR
jgi:hypothetical protein